MGTARALRRLRLGRFLLALPLALGSVACGRPSQGGTKLGQIDVASPSNARFPGFETGDEAEPKLTDDDVERVAVKLPHGKVPAVTPNNPVKGPASAKVTLQVFSDFECPFCVRAAPTLDDVEARFHGRIRLVWRNYPLPSHARARPAARAAMAAFQQKGDDGFWAMHEWLYGPRGDLSDAGLMRAAERLSLDRARLENALHGKELDALIDADMAAGDAAGIEGTPAVFVNDYYMMGARFEAEYAIVVERALREAGST
jgi:protein-disulfide isomerase